ncbi:MAG: prenyltransferase/squalene oxidase repeat-containing protein [Thermoguttaceae bacterium]
MTDCTCPDRRRQRALAPRSVGFLIAAWVLSLVLCLPNVPAQDPGIEAEAGKLITPATDQAIANGLAYLDASQHDDGSFASGAYRGNVAICGLAGLAFMAGGNTPVRGPYGDNVALCVQYIRANTQESGFICAPGSESHGPMYGHGFAALFLAECYGMSQSDELRDRLGRAVDLIVNTQNDEGGWRYQPRRLDADISVTICQVMALRAARNAGIEVPRETIDKCIDYVRRSQNPDGGFMYMVSGGESGFARSAAGVVALHSAGVYEGPELAKGIEYLMKFLPGEGQSTTGDSYYFYAHYYAVQAMWRQGGDAWQKWYPAIRDEMVGHQRTDGSWMSPISPEYATAMCCIVLQVPNNYLPILQR